MAAGENLPTPDAVAALTSRLKSLAPFILHIEDAHEADPQSRAVILELAESVRRARGVALLVTSRTELPQPFVASLIEPHDFASSRALLEAEASATLPLDAAEWVFERAAGNPLYTLEYFRYLARLGHLWNDGRTWRWRAPADDLMPVTVEALVEQRLRQAYGSEDESAVRSVLQVRAYLGPEANAQLLATVAGVDEPHVFSAQNRLVQARLLTGPDGATFTHPLFREVALRTLEPSERREFARRALAALSDEPLKAAAFVGDADLPADVALKSLVAAADAADTPLAAAQLRAAAARLATGTERAKLALAAANVLHNHDVPEAQRLLEIAVEDPATRPDALLNLVNLLAMLGRQREADELADRLTEVTYPGMPPAALKLSSRNTASDHRGAWEIWEAHPELSDKNSPELLRAAGAAALATGRMAEAATLIQRCEATTEDLGMRCEMISLRALLQFHSGNPAGADALMTELFELLDTLDAPRLRATALMNRSVFLRLAGRYEEVGDCLAESLSIRQGGGDGKAYASAMVGLADLRVEQGRFDEADDLLTEALTTLEIYGPSRQLTVARTYACKLGMAQGTSLSRLAALRQVERALSEARRMQNPRLIREVLIDAALAHGAGGDASQALVFADESAALAASAGDSPVDLYREWWARGMALQALGQLEAARAAYGRAYEGAATSKGAIEMHKIGLHLAATRGDAADANTRRGWFRERGLELGALLAKELFPELAEANGKKPESTTDARRPRIDVLGLMRFSADSKQASTPVKGEKRQLLLAALLEARVSGRLGVSKLDLFDLLYPGQDEAKAGVSLRQLVLVLRRDLGPNLVHSTPDGYSLGDCDSDLDRFLERPASVSWRGHYLGGLPLDGQVRDTLHAVLARHVLDLTADDPQEAARLGQILHEAEPYRFDYLGTCLEALKAAGSHRSLESLYARVRTQAAEFGEDLPERWQDFLADDSRSRVPDLDVSYASFSN